MAVLTSSTLWLDRFVQHHDIAGLELGNQELLDPGAELLAVHWPVEGARRDKTVMPQRADEGGRLPMTPRNRRDEALAARASAVEPRHFGRGAGFVDKDQVCALAIRTAAPAIAGALPQCRGGPALRRVATFFKRQPEMTDPRP
jgi:hypothetical protein